MIAKSRHDSRRGILRPLSEGREFDLQRFEPAEDLRAFVDRFWIVRWDLREPRVQETLPHPCVNLSIEPGKSAVHGIGKRKFTVTLEGGGQVVGAKFRPGMFAPFTTVSAAALTGRVIGLDEIFGRRAASSLERAIFTAECAQDKASLLEAFLRERLPERDAQAELAADATELALADREITSVDELARRTHLSLRALQRLFRRYVGVGAKWVIRRARVQEAAENIAAGERVNLARLASELGYFDQTHLIKDFRAQVGLTPGDYAASVRQR